MFTEERLRIPSNAELGVWKINVASGSNLETVEFDCIFKNTLSGMTVKVEDGKKISNYGEIMKIDNCSIA